MDKQTVKIVIPAMEGATDALVTLALPSGCLVPAVAVVELRDEDGRVSRGTVPVESEAAHGAA
jgi:hypothetical protein